MSRVAGEPFNNTENAPDRWRDGPITVAEATPPATPGLSPLVNGIIVAMLCAGAPTNNILNAFGIAVCADAKFG